MTWAIKISWRFEPVEVVKETAKMVFYVDRAWRNRETRADKDKFLPWRGDEATAHSIAAKLISAQAEFDRRRRAAGDWYRSRKDEILASADRSPEGQDAEERLDRNDESAVPKADAQTNSTERTGGRLNKPLPTDK